MDTNKTILVTGLAGSAIIAVALVVAASVASTPPEKSQLPTLESVKKQIIAADDRVFNVTDLEFSTTDAALRFEVYHRDAGGAAHRTRVVYFRDMAGVYRYKTGTYVGGRGETWRNNAGIWP